MKRFSISLPDDLTAWLAAEALRERRSLAGQIAYLLEGAWTRAVGEDEADRAPILQRPRIPVGEGNTLQVPKVVKGEVPPRGETIRHFRADPAAFQTFAESPCTCGPGERVKGKHNRWCPAK